MDELDLLSPVRRCRGCGCTDEFSCQPNGCTWVDIDLCSVCDTQDPEFHTHKFAMPVFGERVLPRRVA
jgi:hypothetical protein